jgi:hypothetical protein
MNADHASAPKRSTGPPASCESRTSTPGPAGRISTQCLVRLERLLLRHAAASGLEAVNVVVLSLVDLQGLLRITMQASAGRRRRPERSVNAASTFMDAAVHGGASWPDAVRRGTPGNGLERGESTRYAEERQ